jgi:hypothetical protein
LAALLAHEVIEPFAREREVAAAFARGERVDLVRDERARGLQHRATAHSREQDVERFGRGDQDVRRRLRHRRAFARRRVARTHDHAHFGQGRIERAQFGERLLQVLLHVVGKRAQRRHVDDL